jgi:hypothetical protein
LLKAALKENATFARVELAVIEQGLFGLGQTYEQVDAHDQTRWQRALGHDLDEKQGPRGQQVHRVQEARAVCAIVARLDLEELDQHQVVLHTFAYLVDKQLGTGETKLGHVAESLVYVLQCRLAERLDEQRQYLIELLVHLVLVQIGVFRMQVLIEEFAQVSQRQLGIEVGIRSGCST